MCLAPMIFLRISSCNFIPRGILLYCWKLAGQNQMSQAGARREERGSEHNICAQFFFSCVKSLQSCPTLCDPMNCNLPGSSVHGILQARTLEWVAMPSRGSSQPRDQTHISSVSCTGRWALYHQHHLGSPLKPQSCLKKHALAQDTLGCRSRHTPRYANSAYGSKATHEWVLDPCSVGDQPDLLSWAHLENFAAGESSGERTWILTKQTLVQGFLASSHRPGLPELPS